MGLCLTFTSSGAIIVSYDFKVSIITHYTIAYMKQEHYVWSIGFGYS